ncbi:hypothetical protein D9M71_437270 [compost metagenome]
MAGCLGPVGKMTGAFEHHIDRFGFPGQVDGVADGADGNAVAIDRKAFLVELDTGIENPVDTVVLEQVRVHGTVAQVVNGDDLQVLTVALGIQCAKDVAADAAKAVDCDAKRHSRTSGRLCEAPWERGNVHEI